MSDHFSVMQRVEMLREFQEDHPELTKKEIAEHFQLPYSTVWRYLRMGEDPRTSLDTRNAEVMVKARISPKKGDPKPIIALHALARMRRGLTPEEAAEATGCARSYAFQVQSQARDLGLLQ